VFGFIPVERPPGAIDLEELAQADYALERALEYGDYGPLLTRMRAGKGLPAEQKVLADIYEKKVKRPRHRMKQHPAALRFRNLCLALCVLELCLKGENLKAAVSVTADQKDVGTSTVYAAVKQFDSLFHRCGLSK
jgi:hypothetical protein